MTFAGEADPAKRADIMDYLRSLSDNPAPLPARGAAESTPSASIAPPPPPPPLPQPKVQAVSDNPQPLQPAAAGVATAGARTEPHIATEGEARRNQTYSSGKAGVSRPEMIFSGRIFVKAGFLFLPGFFVPMMAIKTSRTSFGKG